MKKTIRKQINDLYSAIIEVDGPQILICIEKKCKFLWMFDSNERVSWCELYYLCDEDRDGCSITGSFAYHIKTLTQHRRNTATFNLNKEIDTLYQSYLKSESERLKREKQIDSFINSIN